LSRTLSQTHTIISIELSPLILLRSGLSSFIHILRGFTTTVTVLRFYNISSSVKDKRLQNITLHVLNYVSSIISLEIFGIEIMILHAHPQIVIYDCVKFQQYWFILQGGVGLTRNMDREMDKVISVQPPQTALTLHSYNIGLA